MPVPPPSSSLNIDLTGIFHPVFWIIGIAMAIRVGMDFLLAGKPTRRKKWQRAPRKKWNLFVRRQGLDKPLAAPATGPLSFELSLKPRFFAASEKQFFTALEPIARDYGLRVFPNVRLVDIIRPKSDEQHRFIEYYGRMHVDFALVRTDNDAIVGAIELDGKSHLGSTQQFNDELKNRAFKEVGLRMERYQTDGDNRPEKLRETIERMLRLRI